MTNKEKYKQAFDTLSASDNFSLEVDKMSILNRKHKLKTIAATVATCLIVTAGTGTAYASDLGGIQRKVQLWIHGDQTTATLKISSDGSYEIKMEKIKNLAEAALHLTRMAPNAALHKKKLWKN